MIKNKQKIAVLVSGGVDSSVALALLKKEGHDVTAYYMKIWLEDELSFLGECPWEDDIKYVQKVCEDLEVPLYIVPFQKEYWETVVAYTIKEVKSGRTPNPDMLCNANVKFGAFYAYLERNKNHFDLVATGHYAQTEVIDGKTWLRMSPDSLKDQTYFLSQLTQEQIQMAIFPIGRYPKREVRKLAQEFGLPNATRKDSQGICFLGKIPFDQFVKHHLGIKPGNIKEDGTDNILGTHEGYWFYTVGQRKGIKLSGGPWYVTRKNTKSNEVFVAHGDEYLESARNNFVVSNINWITKKPISKYLEVKVRHGESMVKAKIKFIQDNKVEVTLEQKDQGIAEGQFAVFYDNEYCLGGGSIEK